MTQGKPKLPTVRRNIELLTPVQGATLNAILSSMVQRELQAFMQTNIVALATPLNPAEEATRIADRKARTQALENLTEIVRKLEVLMPPRS